MISFIIPAMQFTIEREAIQQKEAMQPMVSPEVDLTGPGFQTSILVGSGRVSHEAEPFNWLGLLPYLYGAIVSCLLALAAWRLFQLLKHTKASVKEINGLKLVAKGIGFTNCSFFNYVFIDENSLTGAELTVLLAHEEVHAKQYHSMDKLFLMITKAFLWFNPIIYLYDRALEEAHEYEADETTSQNVGAESYATLLLNLAVSKSQNPLIHNFVKSPIKQRIKMLFNSKSTNMKKLAYLLALPIGLGLIWGFTVKVTHRIKPLVQQETPKHQDTLIGKTVKGKVISFEKSKMGEVLNLQVGNTIMPINYYDFKSKVKIGDEITIVAGGKSFLPPPVITVTRTDAKGNKSVSREKAPYFVSKVIGANGKTIYELPHHAFLYEANRVRFAWSTIKSIEKNDNGTINRIVLNDKHGFTINLNVAAQQFKNDDFKKGDDIEVKFIGEKLTGTKTYTTDKMIALYSLPKKHELINKLLYSKFYHENGKQKVYTKSGQPKTVQPTTTTDITSIKIYPKPILLTSSSATVINGTRVTYIKNAKMKLFNGELNAQEVEMDMAREIVTAKNGTFKTEKGNIVKSELMTFNNATGAFSASYPTGATKPSAAFNLISKLTFSASDSIKVSKLMDENLILSGNVKMKIDNYLINGKVVTVNRHSNTITAYLGSVVNGDKLNVKADMIEFDLETKEVRTAKSPLLKQ